MKYRIEIWTIKQLLDTFDQKRLNLNPPYQRNDIWTIKAQSDLITTIKRGFPIPNFFLHERGSQMYDIADGQQRTRALLQYRNGEIPDNQKSKYNNEQSFLDYKLSVQIIDQNVSQEEIMKFYVKVNKAGAKLNTAELRKADNFQSKILPLVERLANNQEFRKIEIFNQRQQDRMIDREFVEELVALLLFGIQDKKEAPIQKLYDSEDSLTDLQLSSLENSFIKVLSIISKMYEDFDFPNSRYSQRNDFYTLFYFIYNNLDQTEAFFKLAFEVLFKIAQDISPSNDECDAFQNYAINCVSQSNSKNAREKRLAFFNELLRNPSQTPNDTQKEIIDYYGINASDSMINIGNFFTINPKNIQQ